MDGDDQFSFPVVSNPVSHPMQSPPLWRISSVVYHHDKEEDTDSFYNTVLEESGMEREVSSRREGRGEAVEEKIDMLWQDFFCKEEKLGCGAESMGELEGEAEGTRTSRKQLCIPGGGRIATRGAGVMVLVAIMKLLKKMHMLRNNPTHKQPVRTNVE